MGKILNRAIIVVTCVLTSAVWGQVNTETMRRGTSKEDLSGRIGFSLGYKSGNTEGFNVNSRFQADYYQENYHAFVVANYKQEESSGELLVNKAFVHVRGVKAANSHMMVEGFVQEEFNDFVLLQERSLIGTGVRWAPLQQGKAFTSNPNVNLFVGIGMMWEWEELDVPGDADTKLLRSTNYVSGNWRLADRVYIQATGYFQFDTYEPSDYRVLSDAAISFEINKKFEFKTELTFRYDHEPPEGVENHDLELTNGIQISF